MTGDVNLQQGNRLSLSTFFVRLEESQVSGQQENHVDTNIADFSRGLKKTGLTWLGESQVGSQVSKRIMRTPIIEALVVDPKKVV
uniref:Uncharacterized protein n=1 Tax=Vitis vinifera TaxID=29760 RepID=F6H5Q6_VITVI